MHRLQNVLHNRIVLLIELSPSLAREAIDLQRSSSVAYLDSYSGIDDTFIGVDTDGERYVFGLRDARYELPLISLITRPSTIARLMTRYSNVRMDRRILQSILSPTNMAFEATEGIWSCVWSDQQIVTESSRVMTEHFDRAAASTGAWAAARLGKEAEDEREADDEEQDDSSRSLQKPVFDLSWEGFWLDDFLECSRILSRGRYIDEIALRLRNRLQIGLELHGHSCEDVDVLVAVTAPALLLANALHRWWPTRPRPMVADLSYYALLNASSEVPSIATNASVVVVQDVLNAGSVTQRVIDILSNQKAKVFCVLSFVGLDATALTSRMTNVEEDWDSNKFVQMGNSVPSHSLVKTKRPNITDPAEGKDDNAFWIEPRSLRPIRYMTLRREFKKGRDKDLDRRDQYLGYFDRAEDGCLLAAGHYVYGRRHFTVAVDERNLFEGNVGDLLAPWLADICEDLRTPQGGRFRQRIESGWETQEGWALAGDVTAVLLPLHSQIHYLWPKVEAILARRGRRQPMWQLDATLFSGEGPAYKIPPQLTEQIFTTVRRIVKAKQDGIDISRVNRLRILIVDDAIATGRTADTILLTLIRAVDKAFRDVGVDSSDYPRPIEWIRYFAILNQMSFAEHVRWHNMTNVGKPPIKFVLEEFAPFMGVPVYDEAGCPICIDRMRMRRLLSHLRMSSSDASGRWLRSRIEELHAVAIDSPQFRLHRPTPIPDGIDVLAGNPGSNSGNSHEFWPKYADTAIWRFYELMYLSYPPKALLRSLNDQWARPNQSDEIKEEFARYRYAVLEWCLRNWTRVEAGSARDEFVSRLQREVAEHSSLVLPLLEAAGQHYSDPYIVGFVKECIAILADFDVGRLSKKSDKRFGRHIEELDMAISIFWLAVPEERKEELSYVDPNTQHSLSLLSYLKERAADTDPSEVSLVRNLVRRVIRSENRSDPAWALVTVAESLFRGRNVKDVPAGTHALLPRVIKGILERGATAEDVWLLQGSLTLFLTALEDMMPFFFDKVLAAADSIKTYGKEALEWVHSCAPAVEPDDVPTVMTSLSDALHLDGTFCEGFKIDFHADIRTIESQLDKERNEHMRSELLQYSFEVDKDLLDVAVIAPGARVIVWISNFAIEPISQMDEVEPNFFKSVVRVSRLRMDSTGFFGGSSAVFRVLTNFTGASEADHRTSDSRSSNTDVLHLTMFGARDSGWTEPSSHEAQEGFLACRELTVPAGFTGRKKKV